MEQVPVIEADEVRFAVAVAARAMLDSSAAQPRIPQMFRLCMLCSLSCCFCRPRVSKPSTREVHPEVIVELGKCNRDFS